VEKSFFFIWYHLVLFYAITKMLLPSKAELGFEAHGANKLPSISFLFGGVDFVTWLST
jgi:hypothetical protein